jgi:hypothetical protein
VVVLVILLLWVGAPWIVIVIVSIVGGLIAFAGLMSRDKDALSRIHEMSDDQLESEKAIPTKESLPRRALGGFVLLIVVVIFWAVVGGVNEFVKRNGGWERLGEIKDVVLSNAFCEPIAVATTRHIYEDAKGDPDFGYQVKATIKNSRGQGKMWLEVTLSTDEGKWTKRAAVDAAANTTQAWLIDFPEPTIASEAGDINAQILCSPGKSP